MKSIFPALLFFLLPFLTKAQCPEMTLGALQILQKTDATLKEAKILEMGFDLQSEYVSKGNTYRTYSKCWQTTIGDKAFFEQKILWNTSQNNVTFLTLNKDHYQNLRNAIQERHPSTAGVSDWVIGKMFQYRFAPQAMDGLQYEGVWIDFKS